MKTTRPPRQSPPQVSDLLTPGQLDWDRIILGLKKTTKAFIENVLENIIESIVVTTLDGRLVFFNKFSEELFGYRSEEVLNRHVRILGVREPDVLSYIRRNQPFSGELVFRRKDGTEFLARVRSVPLRDEADRPIAMVGVASDLTSAREKERIAQEIETLKERLFQSEKMAVLGTLASEIAHEINNPLGGLIMAVQMLSEDFAAKPKDVFAETVLAELRGIERDARRCKRITQRLLDFSRTTLDDRALLDLNRVTEDALLLVQPRAELGDIVFAKQYAERLPGVWGDSNSLQQVVINLVRNARDAMPEGGCIEVRTSSEASDRSWVRLSIADSGPGISDEVARRLFDPFFTTKPRGAGTGLGLAISKRIVEEHGGRISFANRPEAGAAFDVLLPTAAGSKKGRESESGDPSFGRRRRGLHP